MTKLPLNSEANAIRNITFSEKKEKDHKIKEEMISALKEKIDYKKDEEASKLKRERREKIRDLAGNDPEKIKKLKDVIYNEEEKEEGNLCPFPEHEGYAIVWKKISPEEQKKMKENIRISADGKIEVIKMKKKFSILTAGHNHENIFKGECLAKEEKTKNRIDEMRGVTYLEDTAAKTECKKQGLKPGLLENETEVKKFISYFPGESTKEKIFNFVQLFNLKKSGYYMRGPKKLYSVGSMGFVKLSKTPSNNNVYEVRWSDDSASMDWVDGYFTSPFIACEDC